MKKKNGFTLVELIAVILILGILLLIVIPRVSGIAEKQKKDMYISDAVKMIASAKSKYKKETAIKRPTANTCVVFSIEDLGIDSVITGPNSGEYDKEYSYVTINYNNGKYTYGVQLLEKYKSSGNIIYRGVKYTTNLTKEEITNPELYKNRYDSKTGFMSLYELNQKETNCVNMITKDNPDGGVIEEKPTESEEALLRKKVIYNYSENGGTSADITEKDYEYNESIDLSVKAEKEGYDFIGWNTDKDAKEGLKNLYKQRESIELYAIYKKDIEAEFYYYDGETKKDTEVCTIYNKEEECIYTLKEEIINSKGYLNTELKGISTRVNNKTNVETFTSKNTKYYAYYEGTIEINYQKGDNVESVAKEKDICQVDSLIDNNLVYQRPNCNIVLPDYTESVGYTKIGWNVEKGKSGESVGETYNVSNNTILYANTDDFTKPGDIVIKNNEDRVESARKEIEIELKDLGSGLSDATKIRYGFSKSKTTEPERYTEVVIDTKGQKTKTYTIVGEGITGEYYLFVEALDYKDNRGNSNLHKVTSTGKYNFNNTARIMVDQIVENKDFTVLEERTVEVVLKVEGIENVTVDGLENSEVYVGSNKANKIELTSDNLTIELKVDKTNTQVGNISILIPAGVIYNEYHENPNKETKLDLGIEITNPEYTIEYDLNGGNVENNPTKYRRIHEELKIKNPTKQYYKFIGWTGTGIETPEKDIKISVEDYGDKHYLANYEANEFTITYELNGGSFATDVVDKYTVDSGSISLPIAAKGDYEFLGWSETNGSKTGLFEINGSEHRNIKLYAVYRKLLPATIYYYNGGQQQTITSCYIYNNETVCQYSIPSEVTSSVGPASATYDGLSSSKDSATITTTFNSNKDEYYAVYKGSYSATYKKGTGVATVGSTGNSCTSYKVTNGTSYYGTPCGVTLPRIGPAPGYQNGTWYNEAGTNVGTSTYTLTKNETLTANASPVPYSITYDNNGGSGCSNGTYYVTSGAVTLCTPSRSGYNFTGWTGSNGSTPQTSVTIPAGSMGNKSYTANWAESCYKGSTRFTTSSGNAANYTVFTFPLKMCSGSSISIIDHAGTLYEVSLNPPGSSWMAHNNIRYAGNFHWSNLGYGAGAFINVCQSDAHGTMTPYGGDRRYDFTIVVN